jgi:hypothetical protein
MFTLSFDSALATRGVARSVGRRAWPCAAFFGALAVCAIAPAQVITYEANAFPDELGWERRPPGAPHGDRRLEDGWLIQTIEHDQDFYRFNIGGISGLVGNFFVEWRAITDNPEWLIDQWQVPAVVSAAGNGPLYHTVMTESTVALSRLYVPRVIVPITSDPHTFRVEVLVEKYIWYIDGVVVDSGVPEGGYPDANAFVIWGAEVTYDGAPAASTAWDFVRVGRIPDDGSGDYDSDGSVTLIDQYFVADCLTKDGPGIFGGPENDAGPGCRFADFDADTDVDLLDFAEFQNLFNGQ